MVEVKRMRTSWTRLAPPGGASAQGQASTSTPHFHASRSMAYTRIVWPAVTTSLLGVATCSDYMTEP